MFPVRLLAPGTAILQQALIPLEPHLMSVGPCDTIGRTERQRAPDRYAPGEQEHRPIRAVAHRSILMTQSPGKT